MKSMRENYALQRLPELLAAVLLIFLAICMLRHVLLTVPFPYPVEYGEGVTVNWTLRASQGLTIYPQVGADTIPWLHNPYGPLWFYIAAPFVSAGNSVFMMSRILSLIGFLACVLLLYRFCRRELSPAAAVGACALLAASPLVWRYAAMARVDLLALATSLAAVWFLEIAGDKAKAHVPSGGVQVADLLYLLAGLAAAVTVLIKPLFIAALLAGAVVGFRKGWRPLGVFTVGLALPLVSTAVWLIVSGNTAVISHFGKMNAIGHSFGTMLHLALTAAGRHPFAFLILLFGLWTVDKNSPRWWFALFTALSLAASAKVGADAHYYLAPLAAAVLLAGPVAMLFPGRKRTQTLVWCLTAQLALYIPLAPQAVFTATYGQEVPAGQTVLTPNESDREIGRLLVEEIRGASGPVLADDVGYVLAAGRQIQLQPFQYGWLARRGKLDTSSLTQRIRDGFFSLVVIRVPRADGIGGSDLPQQVNTAVEESCKLHREIGPYRLYVPQGGGK